MAYSQFFSETPLLSGSALLLNLKIVDSCTKVDPQPRTITSLGLPPQFFQRGIRKSEHKKYYDEMFVLKRCMRMQFELAKISTESTL